MTKTESPLEIWCWLDGKPGHENQTRGLVKAIKELRLCEVREWSPPVSFLARYWWRRQWQDLADALSPPALIIGAGHRTHRWIRLSKKRYGGNTVVLMKPSWPSKWFDLRVIPEHDHQTESKGVLVTRGVLNGMTSEGEHDSKRGLMLIGGPCRHVLWDQDCLQRQMEVILKRNPSVQWIVTNSRRTPAHMSHFLRKLHESGKIHWFPVEKTHQGWVAEQLSNCGQVWVSADSVSMVYESVSSGLATGLMELEWAGKSKLQAGLESLEADGLLMPFTKWENEGVLSRGGAHLNEARRVAEWIDARWFSKQFALHE